VDEFVPLFQIVEGTFLPLDYLVRLAGLLSRDSTFRTQRVGVGGGIESRMNYARGSPTHSGIRLEKNRRREGFAETDYEFCRRAFLRASAAANRRSLLWPERRSIASGCVEDRGANSKPIIAAIN